MRIFTDHWMLIYIDVYLQGITKKMVLLPTQSPFILKSHLTTGTLTSYIDSVLDSSISDPEVVVEILFKNL